MSETKEKNTWTTLSEEVKYETPWIKVTQYDVLNREACNLWGCEL
jgi:hypothetical protein